MNTAKKRERAHRLIAKVDFEPKLDSDNYVSSLMKALNYYNSESDDKERRKWVMQYFVKQSDKAKVIALNLATDFELRSLSFICRLAMREQPLAEKELQFIETTANNLVKKYKKVKAVVKEDKPEVVKPSVQDRIEELAHTHAAEFDAAMDDFTINKKSDFSAKAYLASNSVSAPVAKRISEFYKSTLEEIQEAIAGDDKQLVEGYSNFTKRELKKFADFIDGIITDCQQQIQTAKANRAPRKRKPQPAVKIVAKMKFMREFAELNLKSIKPESIIGSEELWVYNTKYRKVQVYKAESGTLSVKGTTILGFDVKESKSFTLRKPEEFFKGVTLGKRSLNGAIKKLTTKPATPNGRVNEECILLGAF